MIRIASFNLENLFARPVAMNSDSAKAHQVVESEEASDHHFIWGDFNF